MWDITEEAKSSPGKTFSKDDLKFELMIRQPDFVDADYAQEIIKVVKQDKNPKLIDCVLFKSISEGTCGSDATSWKL